MWDALGELGKLLASIRDLLEVVLGSLISLAVAKYYFRRQLHLELMIRFAKLTIAYKRYSLSQMKLREKDSFPDYVHEAMAEYKEYFDVYLPEGDIASSYSQAMKLAQNKILEHPEKFEPMTPADAHNEAGTGRP
jgi:hypothetical protein